MGFSTDGINIILDYIWIIAIAGVVILGVIAIVRGWKRKKALVVVVGFFVCLMYVTFYSFIGELPVRQEVKKWTEEESRKAAEKRFNELKREVKKEQSNTVGMTDATRKLIFWDLVELQDSLIKKYPYDNQKQQEAYKIIAKKYDVLEFVVRQIAVRGVKEGWPQPPLR